MKKTTNATFGIGKGELVQVALLQTHGENGAYLLLLLGSLIGVSPVHFCQMCSARYTSFSFFLCQLVHLDALLLGPTNSELRITIS